MLKKAAFLGIFFFSALVCFGQQHFIENKGQWNKQVLFKAKLFAGDVFIEKDGIRFFMFDENQVELMHEGYKVDSFLNCHVVKMELQEAKGPTQILKEEESPTLYNFYKNKSRKHWAESIRAYRKITLVNIYDDIDLEIIANKTQVKYNFIVKPGGDPEHIKWQYLGADALKVVDGKMLVATSLRDLYEEAPFSYQKKRNGELKEIPTDFFLEGDLASFKISNRYDKSDTLVIDPTVVFSTYSGSLADNFGYTATYDNDKNAFSGGTVFNFGFPVTTGAFQIDWKGGSNVNSRVGDIPRDIGILKYSEDGSTLIFATYLGGSHNEDPHSMVADSKGNLFVFGNTGSSDFPVSLNGSDTSYNGNYDAFVSKFSPTGRLLGSTYVGGSDRDALNGRQLLTFTGMSNTSALGFNFGDIYRGEIQIDWKDRIYVATTTQSDDFPVSNAAFQQKHSGNHDAVFFRLNNDLSQLESASYFGGNKEDAGYGIAIHSKSRSAFVCGGTQSESFQFPNKAYQDTFGGNDADGYVLRLSLDFDSIKAGTYIGTRGYDQAYLLQVDDSAHVFLSGQTRFKDFPVVNAKFSQTSGKQFIAKFSGQLDSAHFISKFGSGRFYPDLSPSAFLVDQCGRIYYSGWGGGANFQGNVGGLKTSEPNVAEKSSTTDSADFYLAVFEANMDTMLYGSYFGGDSSAEHVDGGTSRYSKAGIIYQAVCAGCGEGADDDFPTTNGAHSETNQAIGGNNCNNAIFKLDFDAPVLFAGFDIPDAICINDSLEIKNQSTNAVDYDWTFSNGATSILPEPKVAFKDTGVYTIQLIVTNILSCPGKDTLEKEVRVYATAEADFDFASDDCGSVFEFEYVGNTGSSLNWSFGNNEYSNFSRPRVTYRDTGQYIVKLIADSGKSCEAEKLDTLAIGGSEPDFDFDTDSCDFEVDFYEEAENALSTKWRLAPGVIISGDNIDYDFGSEGSYDVTLIVNEGKYCEDSVSKTIELKNDWRNADFSVEIDSCTYSLTATEDGKFQSGYKWQVEDTTVYGQALNYSQVLAKDLDVTLISDPFSDCPDTLTKKVEFEETPFANFRLKTDSCVSQVQTVNNSFYSNHFRWETAFDTFTTAAPTLFFADTGSFFVRLIANPFSACADSLVDTIEFDFVKFADFSVETVPCEMGVVLKDRSLNAGSYFWDYGNGDSSISKQIDTYYYDNPGEYRLRLIIDKGAPTCADTAEQLISIAELPSADFDIIEDSCSNVFQFMAEDSFQNSIWVLNGSDTINSNSFEFTFERLRKQIIQLTVTDSLGCSNTNIDSVFIEALPEASFIASYDSCTLIPEIADRSQGAFSYAWYRNGELVDSTSNPSFSALQADSRINLSLVINAETKCEDSFALNIETPTYGLSQVEVGNIISPNGDGANDYVSLQNLPFVCDDGEWIIFNRWGQAVFKTENLHRKWFGTNAVANDLPLSEGNYFYIISLGEERIEGIIHLTR